MPIGYLRIALATLAAVSLATMGPLNAALEWGADGNGASGQWDTSLANWWNDSSAVKWEDGQTAVFDGSGGTVSIQGSVMTPEIVFETPGYTIANFFLDGSSTGLTIRANAAATISSSIFGGAAGWTTPFEKTGGAVLTLESSPVFFESVRISEGELRFASGGSLNGNERYVLADAPGVILSFEYQGESIGSLSGGGASGGIVRPNNPGSSSKLSIYGKGETFSGSIQDGVTATLSLEKSSDGSQILAGTNTYSGSTAVFGGTLTFAGSGSALNTNAITIRSASELRLDNSVIAVNDRLPDSAPIALQGGVITMIGSDTAGVVAEHLGVLSVSGAARVAVDAPQTTVTFSGLQRMNGGTIVLPGGEKAVIEGAANTNGILDAWITVGENWATAGTGGEISAYTAYETNPSVALADSNVLLSGSHSLPGNAAFHSLKLTAPGAPATLTIPDGATLNLTSGGILATGASGSLITGSGKITSSANELIVTSSGQMEVQAVVANNSSALSLTKSGAGTLTLSGPNTYSGATRINQGVLEVSSDANLGAGNTIYFSDGALRATGSFTSSKKLITSTGLNGTIDTNGHDLTFTGSNSVTFTKTGAGRLTLLSPDVFSNISARVNAGTLSLPSAKYANASLNGGRLEGTGTFSTIYSSGGRIAPGGGDAGTIEISMLELDQPTIFEFQIGGPSSDFITVDSDFRAFGGDHCALFEFAPSGPLALGEVYDLMTFSGFDLPDMNDFALSPDMVSAGWRATFVLFDTGSGFDEGKKLSVIFASVPEPSTIASSLVGGMFLALAMRARMRK